MGLFIRDPGEPIICGFCSKFILGPKALVARTLTGTPICRKCIAAFSIPDIIDPSIDPPQDTSK